MPEFILSGDLKEAMASAAARLDGCTAERVGNELVRALHSTLPSRFFRTLADTGCLVPWFEEMEKARKVPAGPPPWHDGSLFDHILDVMDALHGKVLWAWMGLCHDLGKLASPPEKWPSHHGHDEGGVVLAKGLGQRLRLPKRWVEAGMTGARFHMKAGLYDKLRPGTRVDILSALHRLDLVEALFALVRADHGDDFYEMAARDLRLMLAVHLPAGHGLKGPEAGRQLRNLRCQALAAAN
nr:HD domain-containing protein [Desulfobotulus pelophilus]